MRPVPDVPEVARWQAGVFTRPQALAEGWTDRQIRRRMATRAWVRVAGRGLAVGGRPADAWALAWAASLTWPNAVISHLTAGALHGFPVPSSSDAHVVAGAGLRGAVRITVHRVPLLPEQVTTVDGLAVTEPRLTALDCLGSVPLDQALDLWAWLSTRRVLGRADLAAAMRVRTGRPGTRTLLSLLRVTRSGAVSRAEWRLHVLLREAGITGWAAGVPVEDEAGPIGVVDVLFARQRLVVEVDGLRAHGDRSAFVRDRRRQNRLVQAGYLVLRFTWDDLTRDPDGVIRQIRRALAR